MSDLISRQAAIARAVPLNLFGREVMIVSVSELENLPSAQPERKTGRWIPDNNNMYEMRFICSECKESQVVPTIGFTKYKPLWDYCPNCGARLEGK